MAAHNPLREAVVIRRCDNLNKENFWDIAMELCPETMKHFCEWIDRYKYGIQWEAMFLPMVPETPNIKAVGRKFHDLPLEMQVGIIFRFFYDGWNDYVEGVNILDPSAWVEIICILFNEREEKFKREGSLPAKVDLQRKHVPVMQYCPECFVSLDEGQSQCHECGLKING